RPFESPEPEMPASPIRRARETPGLPSSAACGLLEFSRPLLRPALDDDLFVRVEFHGVAALCMEHAEEAALPSAERKVRHGRRHADVHAHVAGRDPIAKLSRRG